MITFSNLFVSLCVAAFTHLTYLIYKLPKDNLPLILIMVFCFSFFTYNFQRFIKLRSSHQNHTKPGNQLKWMIKERMILTISSIIAGIVGLVCTYFINPICFFILIPMGGLSTFYVVPLLPFYKKSPTLREIPYLKIFIIGLVWSIIVVALPLLDSQPTIGNSILLNSKLEIFQNLLFIIAITLPFDIRDLDYDKNSNLKTIPLLLGVTKTILLSELLLMSSILLLYNSNITSPHFHALFVGHLLTMLVIAFSKKERSELFFTGAVEGLIIVNYGCVLISEYFFSL